MIHACSALKYEERLHKLSITTLEVRHNRADLIQVFKILNDISGTFPQDFLIRNERSGRGNSKKLYKKDVILSKLEIVLPSGW